MQAFALRPRLWWLAAIAMLPALPAAEPIIKTYSNLSGKPSVLNLYLPPAAAAKPRTALLFFHGGSWNSGGPGQLSGLFVFLAQHGFVAASASYRLVTKNAPNQDPGICVADAFLALAWLHQHAAEYDIDPARIAVGGASAGGQMALCLCLADDFHSPDLAGSKRFHPFACVTLNPVVDTRSPRFAPLFAHYGAILNPTALAAIHRLPPTLLLSGDKDTVVPLPEVGLFAAAVAKGGGRLQRVTYPGVGHGFFNPDRASPELQADIERQVEGFLRREPAP